VSGNLKTKGKIAMKEELNNMVFRSIDTRVLPLKLRTMSWSVIFMGDRRFETLKGIYAQR